MPADAPLERPPPLLDEAETIVGVLCEDPVAEVGDWEAVVPGEVVVAAAAAVEVADDVAEAVAVEKASSLICVIDWKLHCRPVELVSLVKVTTFVSLSNI
jgi:hypothetical protein